MTERNQLMPRRAFLALAAGAAALPVFSRACVALDYPTRTVRIICGFVAGQIPDVAARMFAQGLSARLGQQFIVDNRPGAATNIATEMVARADPDGYTMLVLTSSNAANAALYSNLKFDVIRDFAPVATMFRSALVLEVNPAVPVKTIPEFIAYAKANPGKVNYASPGVGTLPHVAGELFRAMTGVDIVHVPYRGGGPAVVDLLAGQVQIYFGTFASAIEQVLAGKLRALAVTTAARAPVLPDVPAMAEYLPGFEASIYVGIAAPRGTPGAIVDKLNQTMHGALADATITRRIAELGDAPLSLSPADFTKLVAAEYDKWAGVIRVAGVRAE